MRHHHHHPSVASLMYATIGVIIYVFTSPRSEMSHRIVYITYLSKIRRVVFLLEKMAAFILTSKPGLLATCKNQIIL